MNNKLSVQEALRRDFIDFAACFCLVVYLQGQPDPSKALSDITSVWRKRIEDAVEGELNKPKEPNILSFEKLMGFTPPNPDEVKGNLQDNLNDFLANINKIVGFL